MIGPKLENCMANEENSSKQDGDKNGDVLGKRKFLNVNDNVENSEISPPKRLCFNRDSKITKPASASKTLEIIVVNGTWETSRQIPSVIAEMHTVKLNNVEDTAAPPEKSSMNYNENSSQEISHGIVHGNVNDEAINNKDYMNTSSDDNKSLSWLINFKVDTLFRDVESQGYGDEDCCAGNAALTSLTSSQKKQPTVTTPKNTKVVLQSFKDQPNPEPVICQSFTDVREKKPPFTYLELIEQALEERGELTVSEIYQWIWQNFPFYKPNDDRWKNSVRHNLSINPSFRKGCKSPQGAGHLWKIVKKDEKCCNSLEKKQRIRAYLANRVIIDEVQLATASIEENKENRSNPVDDDDVDKQVNISVWDQPLEEMSSQTISLEQSAEEILSGVKRNVEVQYLVPSHEENTSGENRVVLVKPNSFTILPGDPPSHSDNYLFDPVRITQPADLLNSAVRDAGLSFDADNLGAPFFITDLMPMSVSLNMGDDSTVFAEEMNFQYFQLASPV